MKSGSCARSFIISISLRGKIYGGSVGSLGSTESTFSTGLCGSVLFRIEDSVNLFCDYRLSSKFYGGVNGVVGVNRVDLLGFGQ